MMKYYLAPLESVTTYVFRNVYHKYFLPLDKYFTPFIVPHPNKRFNTRAKKELSVEHNSGLYVVPQLLTNSAEDFITTAKEIGDMGYKEINLNLGCPSGTVVSKGKGSGFLAYPEDLDRFLDEIYTKLDMRISIKTRIGKTSPDEFHHLIEIYNKYPVEELIIHPRLQTDFYKNKPNWDAFREAVAMCRHSLCYNGDIYTVEDFQRFHETFPTIEKVMCGRGVVANPSLFSAIEKGEKLDIETLKCFHDDIYTAYKEISCGERNVLFKMKELWSYMSQSFDHAEKYMKKIKKSEKLFAYEKAVADLVANCPLKKGI
ncbi:tRNA dihydrouridine synthase [Faecalimonas sp.]